jgi:hypothetical protein
MDGRCDRRTWPAVISVAVTCQVQSTVLGNRPSAKVSDILLCIRLSPSGSIAEGVTDVG